MSGNYFSWSSNVFCPDRKIQKGCPFYGIFYFAASLKSCSKNPIANETNWTVDPIILSYYRIFNQSILSKKTFFLNEVESQFDRFQNIYPSIPLIILYSCDSFLNRRFAMLYILLKKKKLTKNIKIIINYLVF